MDLLPIIDIAEINHPEREKRRAIGQALLKAYQEYGFCYISGKSISEARRTEAFAQSRAFFAEPLEIKNKISIHHSARLQGYEPAHEKESKEAFVMGPELSLDDARVKEGLAYHGPNQFPLYRPLFKETALRLFDEMLELAKALNRALALAFAIDENYFDDLSRAPMAALRFLHYAPQHDARDGISAHTDWGALSILLTDAVPGLEILTKDGSWLTVEPRPECAVINIGNLVERWTNGTLKATVHRVINRTEQERYAIAFFLDMDHDAIIEPLAPFVRDVAPRYAPIKVSDYIEQMHAIDYEEQLK